jgi:sulfhydrogenase subunit alpha
MSNININVKHITRVEGHGNIVVSASEGKVLQCEWQVPEAPRFFEAMVRGRHFDDIQLIVSRICGICSVTHSVVATKAIENAMGVEITPQTDMLRQLMHYAEQLQSHMLHIGYLVAPDLLGAKSVVPLAASAPDAVKTIIKVHRTANQMAELVGGRATHPVTLKIGGMTQAPSEGQLKGLRENLTSAIPSLKAIVSLVHSVADKLPAFERQTEYVSLHLPDSYTFYHGDILSTDMNGQTVPVSKWPSVANEYMTSQSTAKWCKWHRDSYAAGALARFNNNAELLLPLASEVARTFGLKKGTCNPFMNTVAQIVECAQVIEASLAIIETLLTRGVRPEKVNITPKAGRGAAAVEAPRGILFHEYEFDKKGDCVDGNCCIPTNQNHANIQKDFEKFVPMYMEKGEDWLRQGLEMLVRSYDPCISCSTHMLNVSFVK